MKELTDAYEIEQYKQELRDNRRKEQKDKKDYSYNDDGERDRCNDCGSYIDSHFRCPVCDY